jgi:glycosyltransferase involved in cell wall biosynthesis
MKILLFVGNYLPGYKAGGPIKTISNLINSTHKDIKYSIVTRDRDLGEDQVYPNVNIGQWNTVGNCSVFYSGSVLRDVKKIFTLISSKEYDAVYLNSFFSIRFSLIPLLLSKFARIPILLGPRGEFSDGALNISSKKKKIFIKLYVFLGLNKNITFQASSTYEYSDIKKVFGNNKIFIAEDIGSQDYSEKLSIKNSSFIKLVCLSRISPMKNILYALEVLNKTNCEVIFDIYGPLEDMSYWEECNKKINVLPENITVNYKGILKPSDVVGTLSTYDLFFMPTRGENYGHVIAEAFCAGLPVLIANTTPWRDLAGNGIGWDLSLDEPLHFSLAIENASGMSAEAYQKYRENVSSWAKAKFSSSEAVSANIEMFKSLVENK